MTEPTAQPVAFLCEWPDEVDELRHADDMPTKWDEEPWKITPLYASPVPATSVVPPGFKHHTNAIVGFVAAYLNTALPGQITAEIAEGMLLAAHRTNAAPEHPAETCSKGPDTDALVRAVHGAMDDGTKLELRPAHALDTYARIGWAVARLFGHLPSEEQADPAHADPAVPPLKTHAGTAGAELTLTGRELMNALAFIAPDCFAVINRDSEVKSARDTFDEEMETEVTIARVGERTSTDGEHMPAGMYAWLADYPEEGCIALFDAPAESDSSESRASQETARQDEPKPEIDSGTSSSVASKVACERSSDGLPPRVELFLLLNAELVPTLVSVLQKRKHEITAEDQAEMQAAADEVAEAFVKDAEDMCSREVKR